MSNTSSRAFVRLDTMHHDASGQPYSMLERRWVAYTLIAYDDLSDILHSSSDEYEAIRSAMPEEQRQAYQALTDAMWNVLKGIGMSKWDLRTSWIAHSLFYLDELEGDVSNNVIHQDKALWEVFAEYRAENYRSELAQRQFNFSRLGVERQLTEADKAMLVEWKQKREEDDRKRAR